MSDKDDGEDQDPEMEALNMLKEYRMEDLTYEELAERYDMSESTIYRRLKKAKQMEKKIMEKAEEEAQGQGQGAQGDGSIQPVPDDGGELAFRDVVNVVETLEKDEEVSEKVGNLTGLNIETLFTGITRALQGEADKQEVGALAKNIGGIVYGFHKAKNVREQKEEMTQKKGEEDEENVDRGEVISAIKEALNDEKIKEEVLGEGE